eukprot:scaffold234397_cov33-Tisochrysis_lutea.AAC.1
MKAEKELCAAAEEAEAAQLAELDNGDDRMAMSWDGGITFHYGDPAQPIPTTSRRHAAEARCYRAVVAKDAASAPSIDEHGSQQLNRGVYVWWLILFAQLCDESWTTADVVRLKVWVRCGLVTWLTLAHGTSQCHRACIMMLSGSSDDAAAPMPICRVGADAR